MPVVDGHLDVADRPVAGQRAGAQPGQVDAVPVGHDRAADQRLDRRTRDAGVRLVWYVYPKKRSIHVFTSPIESTVKGLDDVVDGGDVLPGFRFVVRELFDRAGG